MRLKKKSAAWNGVLSSFRDVLFILLILFEFAQCAPSANSSSAVAKPQVPCPSGWIKFQVDGNVVEMYERHFGKSNGFDSQEIAQYEDMSRNGLCFVRITCYFNCKRLNVQFNDKQTMSKLNEEYETDYGGDFLIKYRGHPKEMLNLVKNLEWIEKKDQSNSLYNKNLWATLHATLKVVDGTSFLAPPRTLKLDKNYDSSLQAPAPPPPPAPTPPTPPTCPACPSPKSPPSSGSSQASAAESGKPQNANGQKADQQGKGSNAAKDDSTCGCKTWEHAVYSVAVIIGFSLAVIFIVLYIVARRRLQYVLDEDRNESEHAIQLLRELEGYRKMMIGCNDQLRLVDIYDLCPSVLEGLKESSFRITKLMEINQNMLNRENKGKVFESFKPTKQVTHRPVIYTEIKPVLKRRPRQIEKEDPKEKKNRTFLVYDGKYLDANGHLKVELREWLEARGFIKPKKAPASENPEEVKDNGKAQGTTSGAGEKAEKSKDEKSKGEKNKEEKNKDEKSKGEKSKGEKSKGEKSKGEADDKATDKEESRLEKRDDDKNDSNQTQ